MAIAFSAKRLARQRAVGELLDERLKHQQCVVKLAEFAQRIAFAEAGIATPRRVGEFFQEILVEFDGDFVVLPAVGGAAAKYCAASASLLAG